MNISIKKLLSFLHRTFTHTFISLSHTLRHTHTLSLTHTLTHILTFSLIHKHTHSQTHSIFLTITNVSELSPSDPRRGVDILTLVWGSFLKLTFSHSWVTQTLYARICEHYQHFMFVGRVPCCSKIIVAFCQKEISRNFEPTKKKHLFWYVYINILQANFLYKCLFGSFSLVEKSCWKDFRTKNSRVKCWWNWHLMVIQYNKFEVLKICLLPSLFNITKFATLWNSWIFVLLNNLEIPALDNCVNCVSNLIAFGIRQQQQQQLKLYFSKDNAEEKVKAS